MAQLVIAAAAVLILLALFVTLPPPSIDERVQIAVAGTMVAGR